MNTNKKRLGTIIVLDDDDWRHEYFSDRFERNGNYHIMNCISAKEFFSIMDVIEPVAVFLDHDLGDPEHDGSSVAEWMVDNCHDKNLKILIHSMNPVGAKNMFFILKDAGFTNVVIRPISVIMNHGTEMG